MYVDANEEFPMNTPKPRGKSVQSNCFVDSDHAVLFWYSKKQNTVESSTFAAEFVALQISTELISSLCYKLQMFEIPVNEPANAFFDNEAVYKNSAFTESQLKRKNQLICYHLVREAVAAGKIIVHKVNGKDNLANLLTKLVPEHRRKYLRYKIMFSYVI